MWTKSRSLLLTRILTTVFLFLLIGATIALPWLLRSYIDYTGKSPAIFMPLLSGLWASAVPAFISLLCLQRLLHNIRLNQVFIPANLRLIRIVSWCCFGVCGIYALFCFYYAMGLIISMLMGFMGLILRVVKNVLAQAMELKQENDLTV